ncbi:Bacterial membrane flanked domain protein [Streptomyces sp. ADI92-24]|uniref:PH domain-containing protein n=1 Tax=unclassified Streptomyces TaxID=2593676 RepID=UPI000F54D853|nr:MULTISPECIES: PH domain-containing protein [unclassified Streptomyces]MCX4773312.1 PH domain-containing protein [Streptomyces sp. NBC_01285]RPK53048.1 Bacterial membrane flanked domain protein [Streptomyces sp. ADI92-24]
MSTADTAPDEASLGEGRADGLAPPADWRRLDRRTVLLAALVTAGVAAGAAVPTALGLSGRLGSGPAVAWVLTGAVLLIASGAGGDYVRWRRTRYRVGADRVELHTGLLLVKRRSLARERIRSVDLTAHPLQRVLGLVTVRIGTGEHTGGESTLELDPVLRAEGERLRRALLARGLTATSGSHREGELVSLDPRWIRYAPVSFVAPALGGAAAGAVLQVSDWFGAQGQVIEWVGDRYRDTSLLSVIVLLAVAGVLAGVVGALGLWVEMWWNYRLEREPGGTLRIRRGLLTSRSVSIEERRLRGVDLVEPLGVRLLGAARVDAITTGLAKDDEEQHGNHNTLLPAAPRPVAGAVAAAVLRETTSPTGAPLTAHPATARGRRLRRALWAVLAPVLVLALLGALLTPVLLWIALGCAVVGLPAGVLLARDAYRGLGHALSGAYLVTRSGALRRSTAALERAGVIGWTVRQSYFQRRAGLLNITATTAAGAGAYTVYDADAAEGLDFASEAVQGLLEPFLERVPPGE